MNGHELAAHFIANARWETLPEPVQHKALMCLVDNLAATLAGTLTRAAQISADYAAEAWAGEEATILRYESGRGLYGMPSSAVGAGFANAAAANGVDSDDSARYAYGHAGAQVFPVALAVAEDLNLSGRQLLCGMVVGYEVAHRVGRCWHDYHNVYQACGSWGSVAGAATAAHLMGLSPERAGHALGIADYHAPNVPMMRDIADPAMVKHGIPWGVMTGIVSAQLAARGFTGIPSILALPEYQDWATDFGREYIMVDGVAWKPERYACCGWAHAAVEGACRLTEEHGVAPERIAKILVTTFSESAQLGTRLPATTEEAQFNLAWPVAAMLLDGEVGPRQTLEGRLGDPQLRDLATRVEVVVSEELDELCRLYEKGDPRGRFASSVTLVLDDGTELNSGLVGGGLRFPQPGWDEERMSAKFRWLVNHVLEPARTESVLELLWKFDNLPDVTTLMGRLFDAR